MEGIKVLGFISCLNLTVNENNKDFIHSLCSDTLDLNRKLINHHVQPGFDQADLIIFYTAYKTFSRVRGRNNRFHKSPLWLLLAQV